MKSHSCFKIYTFLKEREREKRRHVSLGEEDMAKGYQEMGIPLLKGLQLSLQAKIETCR